MNFNDALNSLIEAQTRLKDLPKISYPKEEIFGIPQRAYGYLTHALKKQYGIDKLQTGNIVSCVFLSGVNENGAFLAHLDKVSAEYVPNMMSHLEDRLGKDYEMTLVIRKSLDGQEYVPEVIDILKPFAKQIDQKKKGNLQMLRMGIDLQGELFYPETYAINEVLDELEDWFDTRRSIPEGSYRTSLDCFTEADGFYIPPEAFQEEVAYHWLRGNKDRDEIVKFITDKFPDKAKCGKFIEMVKGRIGNCESKEGMIIPI